MNQDTRWRYAMREARATSLGKSARPGIWVVIGLASLALCSPGPVRAFQSSGAQQSSNLRWYDAYDRGIAAVKEGNWKAAEQYLTEARDRGPAQSARAFYFGDTYRPFVPDYYLGIVYLRTDRPDQADKAFGAASVVAGTVREFSNLQTLRAEAVKLAAANAAPTPPPAAPTTTTTAAGAGATTPPPVKTNPGPVVTSPDIQTGGAQFPPIGSGTAVTLPPNTTPPRDPIRPTPRPQTRPGGGTGPYVAGPVSNSTAKDTYAYWREGLRAFLVGEYIAAIQSLEQASSGPNAPAQVRLYLASARVGAVLSGRGDASLLSMARQEFQAVDGAQALGPDDRRYISPRILAQLQAR